MGVRRLDRPVTRVGRPATLVAWTTRVTGKVVAVIRDPDRGLGGGALR
jgi:hypothetical protein